MHRTPAEPPRPESAPDAREREPRQRVVAIRCRTVAETGRAGTRPRHGVKRRGSADASVRPRLSPGSKHRNCGERSIPRVEFRQEAKTGVSPMTASLRRVHPCSAGFVQRGRSKVQNRGMNELKGAAAFADAMPRTRPDGDPNQSRDQRSARSRPIAACRAITGNQGRAKRPNYPERVLSRSCQG